MFARALAPAAAALCLAACQTRVAGEPPAAWAPASLDAAPFADLALPQRPAEHSGAHGFDAPERLRPCCAFGDHLGVSLGLPESVRLGLPTAGDLGLPVPGVRLRNVVAGDALGPHRYDAGMLDARNLRRGFVADERNGLVYTCRGGFIDIAHLRDYADWTVFLASRIEPLLRAGGVLELPAEAGRRLVYAVAVDEALLREPGAAELAVRIAGWLALQLSVWHEVATWYGWSNLPIFPEAVSAFSPEDLYSNAVGIGLAAALIREGAGRSRAAYEAAMTAAIPQVVARLGALPPDVSREAVDAVDGLWWDSSRRLPHRDLVIRRNLALDSPLLPWLLPASVAPDSVRSRCGDARPAPLRVESEASGTRFGALARLDVRVEPALAALIPLPPGAGRWLGQDDLPPLVARIRAQTLEEFGDGADRP